MAKVLKYGALVLVLLLVAAVVFIATLDLNTYKDRIAAEVKAATGRDLVIKGDLEFVPSLVPTLAAEGVTLGNAPWGSRPTMVEVGRFEASLALVPLFSKEIQLKHLTLHDAEIFLETDKSGQGNWALDDKPAAEEPAPGASGEAPAFRLGRISIQDTRIVYRDGVTGETTTFNVDELALEGSPGADTLGVRLRARYNELPVVLEGTTGSLAAITSGKPFPVDLKGRVEAAPPLSLLSPVALKGTVRLESESQAFEIKDLELAAGETRLSGELAARKQDGRSQVKAQLSAPVLDLRPFQPEEDEEKKGERMFSKDPLPVAALRAADVEASLSVAELRTRAATLTDVKLPIELAGGRLAVSPLTAKAHGGTVRADVKLDASKTPRLDLDLQLAGVRLGDLPKMKEKKTIQDGPTDMTLKLGGSGESVAAIMASASGRLLVSVGKATLANKSVNLAGADLLFETFNRLNPLADKEPTTSLECAVVNFAIKDGTATTDKGIAMKTPKMSMVGSGAVDLKTEQLDIGIRPYAHGGVGVGLGTIAGAARIGGTLSDPKPVVDAANALKVGATAGAAVMTFGLSTLAQGMFEKQTADPQPCETALAMGTPRAAPVADSKAAPAEETKKKDPVKGAADKVKGALKGLFGTKD
jgi:uncharacterized protein involved in outer membrane biogenesis